MLPTGPQVELIARLQKELEQEKAAHQETKASLKQKHQIVEVMSARAIELKSNVEEFGVALRANEEEHRTTNQLLRLAIQQKLTLLQILEDNGLRPESAFKRAEPSKSAKQPWSRLTLGLPFIFGVAFSLGLRFGLLREVHPDVLF